MNCNDCLIWIGGSYQTVADYLKEAESRGCCRKVPSWPSWVKAGETRVFLAHRDGYKGSDRGSIFGYFVVQGVDIILTQADCDNYKTLTAKHLRTPDGKTDSKSLKDLWINGCFEGPEPFIDFWKKTTIADRLPFKSPRQPVEKPKKPKPPNNPYQEDVIDFILDFAISCEPENGNGGHGGYGVSTDQTRLEEARACGDDGLRADPEKALKRGLGKKSGRKAHASLYFVDALTRWIDEQFCELLKELIKEALTDEKRKKALEKRRKLSGKKSKLTEKEIRDDYIAELRKIAGEKIKANSRYQKGLPEFRETVKLATQLDKIWTEIPDELQGYVEARGAIVLFNKPYPFFRKAPKADFRGLLQIDGDDLVRQVVEINRRERETREITLRYCTEAEPDGPSHQTELINSLAQSLLINKALAGKFLDELPELIARELDAHDKIRLNNIGTLQIRAKGNRRLVKFKVSDVLRKKVNQSAVTAGHKTASIRNEQPKESSSKPTRKDQRGILEKKRLKQNR